MAKISVLVDTDVFIDYFNSGRFSSLFDATRFTIYYSAVTKKELLSKPGLREVERQAILFELSRCRIVKLTESITVRYSELRDRYASLEKEDALIAACALVKNLPLVTRNKKHFQVVAGLTILGAR
jgi:predicted nucleic acid-binding protein